MTKEWPKVYEVRHFACETLIDDTASAAAADCDDDVKVFTCKQIR